MKQKTPEDFWREYEERIGEKVLARGLGRYISGWEEFDSQGWNSIWGLVISAKLIEEKGWWGKIFRASVPQLLINYRDETDNTKQALLEVEFKHENLAETLCPNEELRN